MTLDSGLIESLNGFGTAASQEPGERYEGDMVRRYSMRPTKSVKDQRTGLKKSGLADLWNGALDEFLQAYVALQSADAEQDPPVAAAAQALAAEAAGPNA